MLRSFPANSAVPATRNRLPSGITAALHAVVHHRVNGTVVDVPQRKGDRIALGRTDRQVDPVAAQEMAAGAAGAQDDGVGGSTFLAEDDPDDASLPPMQARDGLTAVNAGAQRLRAFGQRAGEEVGVAADIVGIDDRAGNPLRDGCERRLQRDGIRGPDDIEAQPQPRPANARWPTPAMASAERKN